MSSQQFPCSPNDDINGMVYLPRLCDKIRLHIADNLHPDYHANLGRAMDLWACQLLRVHYHDLVAQIKEGLDDEGIYDWATGYGYTPNKEEFDWWNSYMRNRGFRDDLAEKLAFRKNEAGMNDRDEIRTFFDFIDVDEGRA